MIRNHANRMRAPVLAPVSVAQWQSNGSVNHRLGFDYRRWLHFGRRGSVSDSTCLVSTQSGAHISPPAPVLWCLSFNSRTADCGSANVGAEPTRHPKSLSMGKLAKRDYNRRRRERNKAVADKYAGDCCHFCSYEARLVVHRKDGMEHKKFHLMSEREFLAELKSGQYVRVCFRCHKAVHWCMTYLRLNWNQITEMWAGSITGMRSVCTRGDGVRLPPCPPDLAV